MSYYRLWKSVSLPLYLGLEPQVGDQGGRRVCYVFKRHLNKSKNRLVHFATTISATIFKLWGLIIL